MKHVPAVFAVALFTALAGCGSGVTLPAVAPEEVEIFMPGAFPVEDYKVLSRLEADVPLSASDQDLIDQARARAAGLGADALVIQSIRRTTEGGIELNLEQEQRKVLVGLAVYYPSKHPELNK